MQKEEAKTKFLAQWKDMLAGFFIMIACLALFSFFPTKGPSQDISRILFFLLIIPALYIKLILKNNFKDFGFTFPATRSNGYWFLGMFLVSLLCSYLIISFTSFKKVYILPDYVIVRFGWFLVYELIFVNVWIFLLEAFYRGFVFFTFEEKFGIEAILIPFFSFLIFLILTKNFSWAMSPYMLIALTGGWLTYKTRSFIYSYLMGLLVIIILDAYLIYALKQI